jgi:hypothetical protein
MCLLWRVDPDEQHVRMLGPLVGLAGGPALRARAVVWSRRICKLPSSSTERRRDVAACRSLADASKT